MQRRQYVVEISLILFFLYTGSGNAEESDAGPEPGAAVNEETADQSQTSLAITGLDDALKKLAVKKNAEAFKKLKSKDYPGALALVKDAFDLDDNNPEITNNIGHIYFLLGNDEEAERYLRLALKQDPNQFAAYVNLADILSREGESLNRLNEAAAILKKARELKSNRPEIILRQAKVAKLQGSYEEAERYYKFYIERHRPNDKVKITIGDFFRDLGRTDEALAWYRKVGNKEGLEKEAAERIWDIEVELQAKQFGWSLPPQVISTKARALANKGQIQLNRGNYTEAERLLKEAVSLAPGFAKAGMHLGDVYIAMRHFDEAELVFLRALAIENNAEICYRLGQLYLERTPSPRNAEAVLFFSRALDFRPDWSELRFSLAKALMGIGDLKSAAHQLDLYLANFSQSARRNEALALKQTIGTLGHSEVEKDTPKSARKESMDAKVFAVLGRTRAQLAKGRPEAAMAELRTLPKEQRGALVLNLEAQILFTSGKKQEALDVLGSSLKLEPDQGDTHEQMGIVLLSFGRIEEAKKHFERAQALHVESADYHLARLEAAREDSIFKSWFRSVIDIRNLFKIRARLQNFLSLKTPSVYREDAKALLKETQAQINAAIVTYSALLAVFFSLLSYSRWQRRSGKGLLEFIDIHPEAGGDVQRILSAVRHEILKHNTMALSGLKEAIDNNEEDAPIKARQFLLGLKGNSSRGAVKKRLDLYADELLKIGRSHKFRLNLRHRDPAFSALIRGFTLLEKVSWLFKNLETLSKGKKQKLVYALKTAINLLNEKGYGALQDLLDSIRVLKVDAELILEIAARVKSEPGFQSRSLSSVDVRSEINGKVAIQIPRQAFEDIMANLIRNALQSSDGCAVGMTLEVDLITGLERVVLSVKDRSEKKLDLEMISKSNIEAGLGLTTALVSRYDCAMDVVEEQGEWKKSVRVKLPVALG